MKPISEAASGILKTIWSSLPENTEDPFENVLLYGHILEALEYLRDEYTYKRDEEIKRIRTGKIQSTMYKLLIPKKKRRTIDTEKFQLLFPELYAEHVYVKPHDLEKIFGRRALFQAAIQMVGAEKIRPYEKVNITEVQDKLTADEMTSCIAYEVVEGTPVVARRHE